MKKHAFIAAFAAAVLLLPITSAKADVNLVFTALSDTVIAPGGTFTVELSLQVTGNEQVSGVDFFFAELSAAGFFIVSRDYTGGFFQDLQSSDASVFDGTDEFLDPTNNDSLGASTDDGSSTSGNNVFRIGTFTLSSGTAAPGDYSVSTTGDPDGSGSSFWAGPGPTFPENAITNEASIGVTVVPEPTTWSLLALCGVAALGAKLRRRRQS